MRYLGVHHAAHVVGAVLLVLLEVAGPHVVHPVYLPHHPAHRAQLIVVNVQISDLLLKTHLRSILKWVS